MAQQTVPADICLGAKQSRNNAGIMRLRVGNGELLDIAKPIYDRIIAGEIESLGYDDSTEAIELVNATTGEKALVKFHNVNAVIESKLVKIEKAKRFTAAMADFDQKAYEKAVKDAEGLVL